ncbi:hypothetical protein [Paraburkholderia nodosa]|uniref:hypothetical protein n=1 Tax=Paraburkholderia nodosa TaxID=392320 RepID=UPI0004BCCAE7|nr:hypothetical protein [Paraburkholderia nodosa]
MNTLKQVRGVNAVRASTRYIDRSIALIDICAVIGVVAVLFTGLVIIKKWPPIVWVDVVTDDAYYYLGIVRNLIDHGVSAFLPPFSTNGYQPLWVALLSGSASIFGTAEKSLVGQIYALSFLFLLLFCLASKVRYGMAFPAVAATYYFSYVTTAGMETSMIPFFFILYTSARSWPAKGAIGSLLFLSRLDSLSVVVASDVLGVIQRKDVEFKKYLIILPVIGLYFAINHHYFGTALPVSGLAKSIGNVRGENISTGIAYFVEVRKCILPVLLGLLVYLVLIRKSMHLVYRDELAISLISLIICATYYAINSGWKVWGWYYWPVLLFVYYIMLEVVTIIKSQHAPGKMIPLYYLFAMIGVILFLAKPALGFSYRTIQSLRESIVEPHKHLTFGRRNIELISYLHAQNISPGSFFAMGDRAGSFGFFLGNEYRFIHTEGLVGPYSYYQAMSRDKGLDFINRLNVNYLVADRGNFIDSDNIIGVVEPVQPLSSKFGDYLLCFKKDGIALDQSYFNEEHAFQKRYLLDFKERVDCPRSVNDQFVSLRSRYGGIAKFSGVAPKQPGR